MTPTSNALPLRVTAIREQVTIFEVFDRMGLPPLTPETQQMRCPFHADRSPSARVYADQNKLYCFTCQRGWDVIDAVMDHWHLALPAALTWIEQEFGIGGVTPSVTGAIRTVLLKRPSMDVAMAATQIEGLLKTRKTGLGYERYTKALLALDLTVYESKTLNPAQLQSRLSALTAATRC